MQWHVTSIYAKKEYAILQHVILNIRRVSNKYSHELHIYRQSNKTE